MRFKVLLSTTAACLAATISVPASAAEFFFNFETSRALFGGPVEGSGVFTTSDTPMTVGGQTAFAVTGITGTFNGQTITGPTLATFGNFFPDAPNFVDGSGIRFNTTGITNIALFFDSNANSFRVNAIGAGRSSLVTANAGPVAVAAAVPEPGTWAMMLLGFGFVGGAMRSAKRRQKVTVSYA